MGDIYDESDSDDEITEDEEDDIEMSEEDNYEDDSYDKDIRSWLNNQSDLKKGSVCFL